MMNLDKIKMTNYTETYQENPMNQTIGYEFPIVDEDHPLTRAEILETSRVDPEEAALLHSASKIEKLSIDEQPIN
jgi:hypothetical protein